MTILIGAVILWVVPVFVARSQGNAKNRDGIGYGLLLGWIGVIILALLPARDIDSPLHRECPHCKEQMRRDAHVCPHCRLESEPWTFDGKVWWHGRFFEERGEWLDSELHRP